MNPVEERIRRDIRAEGPMRFDLFMGRALEAYYAKPASVSTVGKEGDFLTSVSVGPLFGRLLARQFYQMWKVLGAVSPFHIIEQGAHDGQLAMDIINWCVKEAPDFLRDLRYALVEPGPEARAAQESLAIQEGFFDSIDWYEDLKILAAKKPVGVFFSNELVDALPVRVVRFTGKAWRECLVTVDQKGSFSWIDHALQDDELISAIRESKLPGSEGYTSEINLSARRWMREVARTLERGYVLTIDYGFPAELYYASFRTGGTLTAYRKHRRSSDVLANPGTQDITAHVDFTALSRAGRAGGLTTLGFLDQQRFLMGIAHDELSGASTDLGVAENVRAWTLLTHPANFGARFQALLQSKKAPEMLDGLRYARAGGLD